MKVRKKWFLFGFAALFAAIAFYQVKEEDITLLSTSSIHAQSEDNTKLIIIDAGHGGYDSGAISASGVYEKDITLSIALETGALLEEEGFDIVYTRTSDEVEWSDDNLEDLKARVAIGESQNAAYYISIHINSSEYGDGASGYEIYLDTDNQKTANLAQSILSQFDTLNFTQNRGLKSTADNSLYVINKNSVPAILIELGFLSDQNDADYLSSSQAQSKLAQSIANGVLAYYQESA